MTVKTMIHLSAETLIEWYVGSKDRPTRNLFIPNDLFAFAAREMNAINVWPCRDLEWVTVIPCVPRRGGTIVCEFENATQAVEAKLRWDDPS